MLEDIVVKPKLKDSKTTEVAQESMENPGKMKQGKAKNPQSKKTKQEAETVENIKKR